MFSLLAVLPSPLLIAFDMRVATAIPECIAMVTHKGVLAISQDSLAIPGRHIKSMYTTTAGVVPGDTDITSQVWGHPLANKQFAVALFNRAAMTSSVAVTG